MITASLLRRRSRMIVALLAIAVGATILSGLVTIYYDVPRQMGAEFRNYGANMIFMPTGDSFTHGDMEAALEVIDSADLVGATPYRYATDIRVNEQAITVAGTDMADVQKTSPYWLVEGEWPADTLEILIGENVAETLSVGIGEEIKLKYTPDTEDDAEYSEDSFVDLAFTVTGIVSTGGSEEDYAYISTEDLEMILGTSDRVDLAEISVSSDGNNLQEYVDAINSSDLNLSAKLVKRVTASETTVLSKLQSLVLLVTVVVLALTMICVATTMTAVVSERRSEVGLRKAIGASDNSIIAEFMGEGMLLGAVGGLVGSLVGFGFAQFVSVNVFSSYIVFRPLLVPITMIVSIAVTGIACLLPIRSATRIDPALVLKGE